MKVVYHQRKRLASHFSIERLFSDVRCYLGSEFDVAICSAPQESRGIVPRIRNILHATKQEADVHHIVGDSHYLAFGLPREKTILTIHDCGALNRLSGWKRAVLKYFWFTGPMKRAVVVTAISEATKAELRHWVGSLANKVKVIPNCVGAEFDYVPKVFNEAAPVALQIGVKKNKNLDRVVAALRGTECGLEVVGGETKGLRDQGTKRLKDEEAIRGLGRLEGGELVEAYRRCDFVIFASLYEGFGLPILEAQATGRPVITSRISPMTEVAGEGALFVDPFSVESIRAAVLRIIHEPTLRENLVRKGLENIKRFRPVAVAEMYAALYRRLKCAE